MNVAELIAALQLCDPELEVRTESGEGLYQVISTPQGNDHAVWLLFHLPDSQEN